MHSIVYSRQETGSESEADLVLTHTGTSETKKHKKAELHPTITRALLLREMLKFLFLMIMLFIAIFYMFWINNAGNFPEL